MSKRPVPGVLSAPKILAALSRLALLAALAPAQGLAQSPSSPAAGPAAPRPQATLQEHCDIAGAGAPQKTADAAACRDLCTTTATCAAFVFVSGWNRCFLKDKKARVATLRFYAGYIDATAAARPVAEAGYDRDDSGKDMRSLPHTKTAAACASACVDEPRCRAFAYLEGYDACYLKSTHGSLRAKVFSCGLVEER